MRITIVSPASARENNGNWQTASRWAHFLGSRYEILIAAGWQTDDAAPDLLIALHARRSAAAIAAFHAAWPQRPSLLVLTGTDLYRDIETSVEAQHSLACAHALVLLQPAGLCLLPPAARAKAHVIYQSANAVQSSEREDAVCMIGHLREEKDPLTYIAAASLVRSHLRLIHIGGALDPALGEAARKASGTRYQWLGNLPHAEARERLARCCAMVIASRMEGGANVIIEAVTSLVPVLASDISGNRGMLGDDYAGYFPPGDAAALARLIDRSIDDPSFHALLRAQCDARAPLFAPAAERAALLELVDNLLNRQMSNE